MSFFTFHIPDSKVLGFQKEKRYKFSISRLWIVSIMLLLLTSAGSWKKEESFRKTSISALLTMPKAFDYVDHNKLRKILREMGIPDHLTFLLGNLYAGQEATVRSGRGPTDWF